MIKLYSIMDGVIELLSWFIINGRKLLIRGAAWTDSMLLNDTQNLKSVMSKT